MTNLKKYLLLVVLIFTFCVQWYVSGSMLLEREATLKKGDKLHFMTAPVDPYDPYRGRYVRLNYAHDTISMDTNEHFTTGEEVYVTFRNDSNNYAIPNGVFREAPTQEVYLKCTIRYTRFSHRDRKQKVSLEFPFDRYYMNEKKAPKAELVYQKSERDAQQKTFAVVSVFEGNAVLESIFINDRRIEEYIELND